MRHFNINQLVREVMNNGKVRTASVGTWEEHDYGLTKVKGSSRYSYYIREASSPSAFQHAYTYVINTTGVRECEAVITA